MRRRLGGEESQEGGGVRRERSQEDSGRGVAGGTRGGGAGSGAGSGGRAGGGGGGTRGEDFSDGQTRSRGKAKLDEVRSEAHLEPRKKLQALARH